MYKIFLVAFIMVGCASTVKTSTTYTTISDSVNVEIAPDHLEQVTDLSHYTADTVIAVPKHVEKKDTATVKVGRYNVHIEHTTDFDSGVIKSTIDKVKITGEEIRRVEKEVTTTTPYCDRKMYILIGIIIGIIVIIAIRKILTLLSC